MLRARMMGSCFTSAGSGLINKWIKLIFMKMLMNAAILCIALLVCSGCATPQTRAEKTWEYKVISKPGYSVKNIEAQLNALSSQGWLFCEMTSSYQGENTVPEFTLVLKRQRR